MTEKARIHIRLKRQYLPKRNRAAEGLGLLLLFAFFIFFAVLRDELMRWATILCSEKNIAFTTLPLAILAAVAVILNLSAKLRDEFPEEARCFFQTMGFRTPDFILLELYSVFPRGAAGALFVVLILYGSASSWRTVLAFLAILIFIAAGALTVFRLTLLTDRLRAGCVKRTRFTNWLFFHNKYLAFFFGESSAARKAPDFWVDVLLVAAAMGFFLYFRLNFFVGAYVVLWLSSVIVPDCYRYDANRAFLFRVLKMDRKRYLRHKYFDLILISELFLAVYTLAGVFRGAANPLGAILTFLVLSLYGAVVQLGAHLVCIRNFPRYTVAGSILYALLSLLPLVPLFLTAFWTRKNKEILQDAL